MSRSHSARTVDLLRQVEPLTFRARIAHMVDLGRRLTHRDADAQRVLGELHDSPEAYDRMLALLSVFGSRDGTWVVQALGDASRSVRRRASRMVGLFCNDAQIVAALDAIVEKRILCRTLAELVRRGKWVAVDTFLEKRMQSAPEPFVIDILTMGSDTLVRRYIEKILDGGGYTARDRLASRHPKATAEWLVEDLRKNPTLDPRRRYRLQSVLIRLAERAPDEALTLLRLLLESGEDHQLYREALKLLVRSRPCQTFDMLKARHISGKPTHPPGIFGVVCFDHVANELGAERLEYLVRHAYSTLRDGKFGVRWFLRLSDDDKKIVLRTFLLHGRGAWGAFLFRYFKAEAPEEIEIRNRAFERWSRAAQNAEGTIPVALLDWLPRDLREMEARRHLNQCPSLANKPEIRITYAGLLGFAEAKQVLAPWLGHPEGDQRAEAQKILISSIRHEPAALPDAIANVKARKFEQDPVRENMFEALGQLRVAFFKNEHLESIGAIVDDAMDAADLSSDTSAHVERLVVRLFRLDGFWAGKYLAKLMRVRGSISTWGIGDGLTNKDAERLGPALALLVDTWTTQEKAGAIITLAQSLGLRLRVVVPVLEGLERLARKLPFVGVAASALGLLSKYDRPRFAKIVPELLQTDESYVLVPHIAHYVSRSRQDLLRPTMLAATPMKGRFATGRTHWVIDFGTGHFRWTATQQRTYATSLVSLLKDETQSVPTARFALSTLVRLPFADATPILPFASDPRQPIREMAIRGLPWLDAQQGASVLVEALADDRARWAIYALRKVFSEMRREGVFAQLRAVPMKKVTVAKEVVRLLGELGGTDAYEELLRLNAPGIHRDVRIALMRALWDHLDKPQTWEVFDKAVRDPDWIVAWKLADIPLGRVSTDTEERVVGLLGAILARPEPEARLELLTWLAVIPLADARRGLLHRLLTHMGTDAHEEAALAFAAVLQRMNAGEEDLVLRRLTELMARRRHFVAFVPAMAVRLTSYAPAKHRNVAKAFLAAMQSNPILTPYYLNLGSRLWGYDELAQVLIDLAKKDGLYHEAMVAALAAVAACVHPGHLEIKLRGHADGRIRRLGLAALVHSAAPENGWTQERRDVLATYQQDKDPEVAGPAQFVFPP